ncbi:hypothetical protein P7K49_034096 [Saguinus oedipus]|uniref:Uncharacterized protein n=1 Tax=Saguinus oedipus TaxID=9490 RepID=A0ABQ9TTS4_SAGOE|nr:hypothetical protein P7K49_034096 [Saguinus oedipus]
MGRPGSSHLDQILPHRTWRDPDPHTCTRSYLFRQGETLMLIPGPDPTSSDTNRSSPYTRSQILPPQLLTDPNSHKTHTRARSYLLRHGETQIFIPGSDPTSSDTERPRSSHLYQILPPQTLRAQILTSLIPEPDLTCSDMRRPRSSQLYQILPFQTWMEPDPHTCTRSYLLRHGETQILTPVPDPTSLDMEKPKSLHLYQILLPQTLRDPDPNTCTRFYLLEHGETQILTSVPDPTSSDIERPRSPHLYQSSDMNGSKSSHL